VVVVGAGFIGLETAEAMAARGKTVRIVQLDDRVLPDLFDREVTDVIERELVASGIALHLGESVRAFAGDGRVERVVTDRGAYPADAVVVATGVRPVTGFLAGSGIERLANGAIRTDDRGRTSLPDVFAAGDCAAVPAREGGGPVWVPLATVANKMGRVVGDNLDTGDGRSSFPGTLATAALRVCRVEAGRTGLSERQAREAGLTVATVVVHDKNHSNYVAGQASVTAKLVYDATTRRLLGGQLAGGAGAALRTDALAAAIWGKLTVDDLAMLDFLYAPPFSRPWDVLNIAGGAAR
jgi:NADPH-dependent 2,4-dienoyl-CoA reductase/sulfur reductase-like enzyme